jgi:DNA-binding beta-propeller fold protein YncE
VALAFDGSRLWIANRDSQNVTVIRAEDGRELMTYLVGHNPWAVLWDGSCIWIANSKSGTVSRRQFAGH